MENKKKERDQVGKRCDCCCPPVIRSNKKKKEEEEEERDTHT
jgi:hypothetical protein